MAAVAANETTQEAPIRFMSYLDVLIARDQRQVAQPPPPINQDLKKRIWDWLTEVDQVLYRPRRSRPEWPKRPN